MRTHGRTYRLLACSTFVAASAGIAACSGGGGGGGGSNPPVLTPSPILVPGTASRYTGTDSIAHVYTSPGPNQSNYTESYTFTVNTTVNAAAAGAPAPFDINSVTAYTTVTAPLTGTQKGTSTSDTFETQTTGGSSVTVAVVGSKTTTVGTDVAAGAAGGGPFTTTTTTTSTNANPVTNGVYPLVTGAVYPQPFGKTTSATTTDVNGGGQGPANAYATQVTQTVANDSSYTRNEQLSNGEQSTTVESSNGSVQTQESGPLFTLQESIGVPVLGSPGYTIPVSETRQNVATGATPAPSATPGTFSAADWYPGAALPPSPLSVSNATVKGPATTLPSACAGAISLPNVVEIDLALTDLNADGSYETETQQRFVSNGVNVCLLRTVTTQNYAVTTGLLTETSTETYAQILTSLTTGTGTSGVKRAAGSAT